MRPEREGLQEDPPADSTGRQVEIERFFELAPVLCAVMDHGRFVLTNSAWEAVLGYSPDELVGLSWRDLVHPEDVAATIDAGIAHERDGEPGLYENRYRSKAGDYRWLRWATWTDPRSGLVYAVAQDATDVIENREELSTSRAWLDAIFSSVAVNLWVLDAEGRVTVSLGHPPHGVSNEALIGRTLEEVYRDFPEIPAHNRRALAGEAHSQIVRDDRGRSFESHFLPARDPDGHVVGAMGVAVEVTQRERALAKLRAKEERYRGLVETVKEVIWTLDADGRFTFVNDAARQVYGRSPEEMIGHSPLEYVAEEQREHVMRDLARVAESGAPMPDYEVEIVRPDGTRVTAVTNSVPIRDAGGRIVGITGSLLDITKRKRYESELRASEEKYRRLVETTRDLIWAIDVEGRYTFVNQAVRRTHGWEPEDVVGQRTDEMGPPDQREATRHAVRLLLTGEPMRGHTIEQVRRDGSRVSLEVSGVPIRDESGAVVGATGTATDVTERKRYETELKHLADHDALTGLYNRRRFEEELERELARDVRYAEGAALLVLDLDNFKYINDTLGHNVGDEVLTNVATILGERLRDSDVRARLGGDEFAVVLPRTSGEEAQEVARSVAQAVREEPMMVGGQPLRLTTSIGITEFRGRDVTARELLGEADLAMYEAKEAGRDRVGLYSAAGHARMHDRMTWADRVRNALEHSGFVLHAQPILDVAEGRVSQHELLIRMRGRHGDSDQVVLPGVFMPTAERFGLVEAIDRWVVTQAIDLIRDCAGRGQDLKFEVNLSGRSFGDPELPDFIARAVEEAEILPNRLVFEITETAAIANLDEARSFASRLTDLGCCFALDDFGTGFGSFHYLKYMPIDYVKLDGDFIRDLAHSPSDQVLVRAMADVAHGLGMKTVAEWVESEATLDKLREFGVDYAQGFHVGAPQPAETLGPRAQLGAEPAGPGPAGAGAGP